MALVQFNVTDRARYLGNSKKLTYQKTYTFKLKVGKKDLGGLRFDGILLTR